MRVHPRLLAQAIANAAELRLQDDALNQLAVALSRGEGLVLAGATNLVVLRDPWDADDPHALFRPTLVSFPRLVGNRRRFRSTRAVIANLITLGQQGRRPQGYETYAPATPLRARTALAGHGLNEVSTVTTMYRQTEITWYNLLEVPVGNLIYRVSDQNIVTLYQRVSATQWMLVSEIDGTKDIVPLPPLLEAFAMAHGGDELEGVEMLDAVPVLLREPE